MENEEKLLLVTTLFLAFNLNAQDTSFETDENYSLGEIIGQNGWEVLSLISAAFTISDEQASDGNYALKLDVDQTGIIPDGSIAGATKSISNLVPANPDYYEISADMFFDSSSTGGELDFYIYGEMGTEALPGAAIAISNERLLIVELSDFSIAVDMQIENDVFHNLKIAFDFVNQETHFYLNGDLLYTGNLNISKVTGIGFLKTGIGIGYADNIVTDENTLSVSKNEQETFIHYINKNNLHLRNNQTLDKITIYNVLGQSVMSKNLNSKNEQINIESLKSGVYLAKISSNKNTNTFKFIKKIRLFLERIS